MSTVLKIAETTTLREMAAHRGGGKSVMFHCTEVVPCMSGSLTGPAASVDRAVARLEELHQASHRELE